jgi:hypothetical protein
VRRAASAERAAIAVALAVAGLSVALQAAGRLETNIDSAAIDRAIVLGRSSDFAARQRFHDQYVVGFNDASLDRLEVVTEFRRVVLETENRVRAADLDWGPQQAASMLAPWRGKIAVTLHVNFPPNNLYRAMPRYEIVLYGRPHTLDAGNRIQPIDVLETPLYVSGQPAPPGTPILAGLIQATFAARTLDRRGVYLAGIAMDGRELRRVEIDFGRFE